MKYNDIPYVCLVKVKNNWCVWGIVNDNNAKAAQDMFESAMFEKAAFVDKRLLHYGEVIRERTNEIAKQNGIASISVISKGDLLIALNKMAC